MNLNQNLTVAEANREFVMSYLHPKGWRHEDLTPALQQVVRYEGDGFGRTYDLDLVWDWSHIRDSSSEAFAAMAATIRRLL